MQIASNAEKVLLDFNNAFKKTKASKTNMRYAPEVGEREMDGVNIKYIRTKMCTEEVWYMDGLDGVIDKYIQQFFTEYSPEGYSSFVLKIAENKYYFYNSNSCD
jgi:hypothetical protein